MTLEDLGYAPFFEESRQQLGLEVFPAARVVSEAKGAYNVKNADGEFFAKITGKQRFEAASREDYPAVGDWVAIEELGNGQAVIRGVLKRASVLKRSHGDKDKAGNKNQTQVIACNIDVAFAVESVDRDFNLNRFERYFTIAHDGGVTPVAVLNKVDLLSKDDFESKISQLKNRFPEVDILSTSTTTSQGLDDLKAYIQNGKTYCFLGSSGVGKSSLINSLLGESLIKTDDVGSYSHRGKHTTTKRQMYVLTRGGVVIDNPGVRGVGMTEVSGGIDSSFEEIVALAGTCKFADCTHTHEPGCGVLGAVARGALDQEKYANYRNLKKEAEHFDMTDAQKREKDRAFGKFKKTVKKALGYE